MTEREFIDKYKLNLKRQQHEDLFIALDTLYLEFTLEQAVEMVIDYFRNADNIFDEYWASKDDISNMIKSLNFVDKAEEK